MLRFLLLLILKYGSRLFYRFNHQWMGPRPHHYRDIHLGLLLNHTSLFEPLFCASLPVSFLWRIAHEAVYPVADITMNRPLVGKVWHFFAPKVVTLSRKRDESWDDFLSHVDEVPLILFIPEGRMKRLDGLDKHGQPMTMRTGVIDLVDRIKTGQVLLFYSMGLHHIHAPGERFPRLFKTVRSKAEVVDISELKGFLAQGRDGRKALLRELERRRDLALEG